MDGTLPDDLISLPEAAALLRVSRKSVTRWIARGRVRAWRVGRCYRVSRSEVSTALAERVVADAAGVPIPPTRREVARERRRLHEALVRLGVRK
jgi:excisionase family DNA binding protein